MKQDELVSIIMPSYNTESFIGKTIESVIAQTYKNWELIIVDDCSTDNTDKVIMKFNDNRIRYLRNEKNSGAAISRNYALREAKGKWIAFLDSDDIWLANKLEEQILFMKKYNYHFSYTRYEEIGKKSEVLGREISGPQKIGKKLMYAYCWPGCLTVMYDAEKVGLIQIEDLKKNNDYAIWLKVIKKCDCYLFNEKLAKYRKREGSISNHTYIKLIKYHYILWHQGENKNCVISILLTILNLFCGLQKKIMYRRKIDKYIY